MPRSEFAYVSYIRAAPEAAWSALTDPEIMKRYWFGMHCETAWTVGARWTRFGNDGTVVDTGEIAAIEAPRLLVIRWRHRKRPELAAEGESLCALNLEAVGPAVKLTIAHTIDRRPSMLIAAVAEGWPKVISNLKSYLETGATLLTDPYAKP